MPLIRLVAVLIFAGCLCARAQEVSPNAPDAVNRTALDVLRQDPAAASPGLAPAETQASTRKDTVTPREARRLRAQNEQLGAQVTELEARLRDALPLAQRAERLASDLAEAQSALKAQEAKTASASAETRRLRSELDSLSETSQHDVKVVIRKLEAEAEQSLQAQKELQRQLTLATQARNEDAQTIRLLREELQKSADMASRAKKLAETAKDIIAEKDAEIANLSDRVKTARQKAIKDQERVLEKADARAVNASEREKALAVEIRNQNQEIDRLQTALTEARKVNEGKPGAADAQELARVRSQLDTLRAELAAREKALAAEVQNRDREIERLQTALTQARKEKEDKTGAANAQELARVRGQLDALRTEFDAREKALAKSLARHDAISRDLEEQTRKADATGTALKQSLAERKELTQRYNELAAAQGKASAVTNALQERISELQETRTRLEQQLADAQKKHAGDRELPEKLKALEKQLAANESAAKASGAMRDELKDQMESLTKDNKRLGKSLAQWQADADTKTRKMDEAVKTARTQEQQLDALGKELAETKAHAQERDTELQTLRQQLATLGTEADALRKAAAGTDKTREQKRQLDALGKDLAETKARAQERDTELQTLRQQLATLGTEADALRKAAAGTDKTREQKRQLDALGKELVETKARAQERDTELQTLRQQLAALGTEADALRKAAAGTDKTREQKRQLDALGKELAETKARAQERDTELQTLRQQLAALGTEADALRKASAGTDKTREQKRQLDALGKELAGTKARAQERDTELQTLRQQLAALGTEADALRKAAAGTDKTREQATAAEARLADLQAKLEQQATAAQDREAAIKRLDAEVQSLRADAVESSQMAGIKAESLAAQLEEKEAALAAVTQREKALVDAAGAAQKRISELEATAAQADKAAVEIDRLREVQARQQKEITNWQVFQAANRRSVSNMTTRIAELADTVTRLTKESRSKDLTLTQRESDVCSLTQQLATAQSKVQDYEQLAASAKENGALRQQLAAAQSKVQDYEQLVASAKENGALRQQLAAEAKQKIETYNAQLEALRTASAKNDAEIADLKKRLADKTDETARLTESLLTARRSLQARAVQPAPAGSAAAAPAPVPAAKPAPSRAADSGLRAAAAKSDAEIADLKKRLADKTDETARLMESLLTARRSLQARAAQPAPAGSVAAAPAPVPAAKPAPSRAADPVLRAADAQKASHHINQGQFRDAEAVYRQMLDRNPDDAEVHFNIAILYDEMLHDKSKAATHYREYLRLRPAASDAARVRAWLAAAESAARPTDR